ncbi:signal transduction histidine kinase [Planomicrobium stackebrandtii]|uniref:histidine kinase n=1 Tax=Planomicrobium stackebrandtii TaxID=253160 RepID=A0ABU0GP99_9BACL|nr:HAMP domain-containing sensor histidine kinase [Planomicrobium stackebrandtii]MDQ0427190.1 signal transduction histidine kinase [Planomicrobium stackebrandtii]
MLRNREIQLFFTVLAFFSLAGVLLAAALGSVAAAWSVFAISIVLITTTGIFTWWRYREIDKLSGYLQKISNGDYQLDVRDNAEGELSLLKSQIYKVTTRLSEQSNTLHEDKDKLTNAISDISHQLKTPLTSMMIMADLLSDHRIDDEKRTEFTRNLNIQLKRMDWLVSSLLKLSKIDAGTIAFKKEPILVAELIEKALAPLMVPMDIKMQQVDIQGDKLAAFSGDLNWTAEALINILKNCVEHTAPGGKLSVRYTENVLFTEITILDNGSGISKQDLPHIFKRFYKGSNASDESVGIGLAMAYSIITSQQGDIEVRSEPETGTVFHIKFYKQVV